MAYDREISISEHRVNPGDIIHNASLILGRQIVHILPEGWVYSVCYFGNIIDSNCFLLLDPPFSIQIEVRFVLILKEPRSTSPFASTKPTLS